MSEFKVLYAENQPLSIEGLRHVLFENQITQNFHNVTKSELIDSGIIAYEPDLLIIDYDQKDFFSLLDIEKITKNYPKVNILIISNDTSIARITKAMELGVHGFITRNSDIDEMLLAIRKINLGEKYFCSKIIEIIVTKNSYPKFTFNSCRILTQREQEIVKNVALGKTNKQIASFLGISHHTVHTHRKNIMKKLAVKSSTELALFAVDCGLIELPC
jgi:DNA-binding NarL/FixJ family response regulator